MKSLRSVSPHGVALDKPATLIILLVLLFPLGCATGGYSVYDELMTKNDFASAKSLMRQQIDELSLRDFNPTLPLRIAEAYHRLAYAHGRLAEYDSMKSALRKAVDHDRGHVGPQQEMSTHFATEEYNTAAAKYNVSDFEGATAGFLKAFSIVEGEPAHDEFVVKILRGLASSGAASGNLSKAEEACRRASAMGSKGAKEMLPDLAHGKTPERPASLEVLKIAPFSID